MKKILFFVLTLVLIASGVGFAELQIDEGQTQGQAGAVSKFFVARNGRVAGISADRVVVWDTTSNDGVSVTTSTTSWDALVVGVTMEALPGITSDATAANNPGNLNWGRVQVYGRHADVSWDGGATGCVAGQRASQSGVAGTGTILVPTPISGDTFGSINPNASRDDFGVLLEACAAANKVIDIFINKG